MLELRVEPRLRRVVADNLGVALEDLTPEVSLTDDLAADSLDLLELALALEEELGFTVPERVLSDVRTYGDLVRAMAMLAPERRAAEARGSGALAFFRARVIATAVARSSARARSRPMCSRKSRRTLAARAACGSRWHRGAMGQG